MTAVLPNTPRPCLEQELEEGQPLQTFSRDDAPSLVYRLCDGFTFEDIIKRSPKNLWDSCFMTPSGVSIRLANGTIVRLAKKVTSDDVQSLRRSDDRTAYIMAGPRFKCSFGTCETEGAEAAAFIPRASLPLNNDDLARLQKDIDEVLVFIAHLSPPPLLNPHSTLRHLRVFLARPGCEHSNTAFSAAAFKRAFRQNAWNAQTHLKLSGLSATSSNSWTCLHEFDFAALHLSGTPNGFATIRESQVTIPTSFLYKTRASSVLLEDVSFVDDASLVNARAYVLVRDTPVTISYRCESFHTVLSPLDVDVFMDPLCSLHCHLVVTDCFMSLKAWEHMWRPANWVTSKCMSVCFKNLFIDNCSPSAAHIGVIPKYVWRVDALPCLRARRKSKPWLIPKKNGPVSAASWIPNSIGFTAQSGMVDGKEETGRKFVQAVMDLHKSLGPTLTFLDEPCKYGLALDDLLSFVMRMLDRKDELRSLKMCTHIDLGYHYTQPKYLGRIEVDGLLSLDERADKNIQAKHNGSAYGQGIYTCNDPTQYRDGVYGPALLLVARLKGQTSSDVSNATFTEGPLVVLRSSAQCVPIMKFTSEPNFILIVRYHDEIQSLIDLYLNSSCTPVVHAPIDKTIDYDAPDDLNQYAMTHVAKISAADVTSTDDCVICFSALHLKDVAQIKGCKHMFHYECLATGSAFSSRCPLCKKSFADPVGKMPSGKMTVSFGPAITLRGYEPGTIQIHYLIGNGTQKKYHGNPGVNFEGADRTAYLPNTIEGLLLLKRLEYAFAHGLTFTVGTSLTSGKANVVTWASIHHKTGNGGAHGFPDSNYIVSCNKELDALDVPSALAL